MGLVVHEIKFCVRLEVIGNVVMRQERRVVAIIFARQINIGLRIEDRGWRGCDRSIRNETGAIHAIGREGIGSALRGEEVRIRRSAAGNAVALSPQARAGRVFSSWLWRIARGLGAPPKRFAREVVGIAPFAAVR